MQRFLESLQPLHHALGPLMFQFEYLNKQKMSGATAFIDRIGQFVEQLPKGFLYCVESRKPNYLNATYFNFLKSLTYVMSTTYPPFSMSIKSIESR